jgi:hypothetical protein
MPQRASMYDRNNRDRSVKSGKKTSERVKLNGTICIQKQMAQSETKSPSR